MVANPRHPTLNAKPIMMESNIGLCMDPNTEANNAICNATWKTPKMESNMEPNMQPSVDSKW